MKGDKVNLWQRDAIFMQIGKFAFQAVQYECILRSVITVFDALTNRRLICLLWCLCVSMFAFLVACLLAAT